MKTSRISFIISVAVLGVLFAAITVNSASSEDDTYARLDPSKVGVFGLPDDVAAKDLGVTWTRIASPGWAEYENNRQKMLNRFNKFKSTKAIATIRAKYGAKTVCAVNLEEYVSERRPRLKRRLPKGKDLGDAVSCMPRDIDSTAPGSYRDFVRSVVKDLKGKVAAWQIENEVYTSSGKFWLGDKPGEFDNFIRLFKAASEEIRALDPNTPILAPGIALRRIDFDSDGAPQPGTEEERIHINTVERNVRRLLAECGDNIDVVDIHLYHTVESIPGRIKWLKKIMKEAGCERPIWSTEIAGPHPDRKKYIDRKAFAKRQADEACLRLKAAMDAGVERVIYFLYQDNPKVDLQTKYLGLLDESGRKKPAYYALQRALK